jgi:hypothetical protein
MGAVLRIFGCGIADDLGEGNADIGDERGQRPGCFGHVQNGFVLEGISAHHVHVHVGAQRLPDVGMPAQESHGAFDLGPPDEAQGPAGARQAPVGNQAIEQPRCFENGHTAAAVIVGAGSLMIQVAAVDDFAGLGIGAGDDGGDH